eukprot:scaffold11228_cov65-Phaeocystis_antarctica.AAC.5
MVVPGQPLRCPVRLSPPASPERARCTTNRASRTCRVGCRHPMDDMWAVARHGEHVQGRGGSDCGSSLAGRTRVRTTLINMLTPTLSWTNPMSNVVKRGHMLHCLEQERRIKSPPSRNA